VKGGTRRTVPTRTGGGARLAPRKTRRYTHTGARHEKKRARRPPVDLRPDKPINQHPTTRTQLRWMASELAHQHHLRSSSACGLCPRHRLSKHVRFDRSRDSSARAPEQFAHWPAAPRQPINQRRCPFGWRQHARVCHINLASARWRPSPARLRLEFGLTQTGAAASQRQRRSISIPIPISIPVASRGEDRSKASARADRL
jgi:hypothetical protein